LKKENKGIILRGAMITGGVCFDVFSSITSEWYPLFKRGEIIQRKIKGTQIVGAAPRKVQEWGATPRGKWPFSIDVKGEIVTLM
jgi:hypothetical protein